MIPLFLPSDVQAMDRRAFARGVDPEALMDAAARHVVRGVLDLARAQGLPRYGLRVALVCGKGNNGADGLVAARHLRTRGVAAEAVLVAPAAELGPDGARELAALRRAGGRIHTVADDVARPDGATEGSNPFADRLNRVLRPADVVVDCLLGTGATGSPRKAYADAVLAIAAAHTNGAAVVACDLPTGVDAATGRVPGVAVTADLTVTLGAHKRGLWMHPASSHVGHLRLGEIGVVDDDAHPSAWVLTPADLPRIAPPAKARDHKRSRGVVVILAGSDRMAGAAILAARGALGAGVGLVTVATPAAAAPRINGAVPEAMVVPLPDDADGIVEAVRAAAERADVLAIGPGLGLAEPTQQAVRALVTGDGPNIVLDADGINAFRDHTDVLADRPWAGSAERHLVLTPQAQEMGRLVGTNGHAVHARRVEVAAEVAHDLAATVVAKGPRSVIARPDGRCWVNPTGGPALATGGTGDVLTGVTAALLAQRAVPESVAAAVYLHGLAGDLAARALSARATSAGDVADHLGAAAQELGI